MKFFRKPLILTLSLLSALTLSSCGGGGGGLLGSIGTALSGLAIDGPLPLGTIIYITNGAPYGQSGASNLGTLTVSAANGAYSGSVTLSSSGAPVFATVFDSFNANVPGMMMTSFLGIDTALGSAGTLNSTTLHELDITPVTTAAVSVYYALNSNYTLTPATYATLIQTYNTDILAIAAGIKSVGDTACAPSAPAGYSGTYISTTSGATNNLGALITSYVNTPSGGLSSTASASVTVGQVSTFLGASCGAYLNTMQTQIQASSVFGPQLLHESTETSLITSTSTAPAFTGSFILSGIVSETGVTSAGAYLSSASNAAELVNSTQVSISGSGAVTSADTLVQSNSSLVGNLLTLNITTAHGTYNLIGRVSLNLQATGGAVWLVQASGSNTSTSNLTNFNGVFAASAAIPLWNTLSYAGFTSGASLGGITCGANTFPLRLSTSGILPLSVVGECVAPASGTITASTSPVWAMTAPTTSVTTGVVSYHLEGNEYVVGVPASSTVNPASMTSGNWTEYSNSNPFVLTAQVTYANTSTSPATSIAGTAYYVVGSSNMVFVATTAPTSCTGGSGTCNLSPNGLLTMGNNELHATGVVTVSGYTQTVSGYTSYHGLGEMNGR